MDIQRYLDNFFKLKDIVFVPGTRVIQNLFDNDQSLLTNQLYFFCDPIRREIKRSASGVATGQKATISFAFVVYSDLDMPYFNEVPNTENKYTKNIEPIIIKWNLLIKELACKLDVSNENYTDVLNIKDINFDGIIGDITFETYE